MYIDIFFNVLILRYNTFKFERISLLKENLAIFETFLNIIY